VATGRRVQDREALDDAAREVLAEDDDDAAVAGKRACRATTALRVGCVTRGRRLAADLEAHVVVAGTPVALAEHHPERL
jgi:hypothetical protein